MERFEIVVLSHIAAFFGMLCGSLRYLYNTVHTMALVRMQYAPANGAKTKPLPFSKTLRKLHGTWEKLCPM